MNTAAISFFVSFGGIIAMMGLKSYELKSHKKSWLSRLAERTDHIVYDGYKYVRHILSYISKKNGIALLQWIAYHILSWVRSMYLRIHEKAHAHPHSKKVIDMVRGKGEIERNGGASFYLKRISEEAK